MVYLVKYSSGKQIASFDDLFELHYVRLISSGSFMLDPGFCLFLDDGKHMILGSVSHHQHRPAADAEIPSPSFNPHSVVMNHPSPDYVFYLIHIGSGVVYDQIYFDKDVIMLGSCNPGVSLCGDLLSIFSSEHQTIKIYRIDMEQMRFQLVDRIGAFLYEEDEKLFANVTDANLLLGIRQKVIASLFEEASERAVNRDAALRSLHKKIESYQQLIIWRAQFLDEHHMILFLASNDMIPYNKVDEVPKQFTIVIWSLGDKSIVDIFHDSTLEDFHELLRVHHHSFKVAPSCPAGNLWFHNYMGSASTCEWERSLWKREHELVTKKKFELYAQLNALMALPFSSQHATYTPWTDLSVFKFDPRVFSSHRKARSPSDYPVKLFSRRSGALVANLDNATRAEGRMGASSAKMVNWAIHPTLPLFVSFPGGFWQENMPIHIYYRSNQREGDDAG